MSDAVSEILTELYHNIHELFPKYFRGSFPAWYFLNFFSLIFWYLLDICWLVCYFFLHFCLVFASSVCASIGGAPFLSPCHHKRQLPCYKLHTLKPFLHDWYTSSRALTCRKIVCQKTLPQCHKTALSCQMVHTCPIWFTLVVAQDYVSHFLGLSLARVSCFMFHGQTTKRKQGSLLVSPLFVANATLFKPLTFHFWKCTAASSEAKKKKNGDKIPQYMFSFQYGAQT